MNSRAARQIILGLMVAGAVTAVHAESGHPTAPSADQASARCVPHFADSRIDGYRCLEIQPGSRYDRLGLKNGDVIRSIDGASLEDPLTALEKLGRLSAKSPGKVSLLIERSGQEISRNVDPDSGTAESEGAAGKKQVSQ